MGILKFLFFLVFLSILLFAQENANFISKVDFDPVGAKKSGWGSFATYSELKVWAYYQGWNLDPDGPYGGIQNGVAAMIPPTGGKILFYIPTDAGRKDPYYLHLDITRYTPGKKEFLRPNVLRIYVNGRLRETLEIFGKKNFQNPVVIPLDPGEFPDGRVEVELEPVAPTRAGKFWGVWDLFLSRFQEEEEEGIH